MEVGRSGTLVGRDAALATLDTGVARAAEGQPGVLLVGGETGIGKTRLVAEVTGRPDVVALAGACVPVAGETFPYAALTQALRSLAGDPLVQRELDRSPELARLAPGRRAEPEPSAPLRDSSPLRLFHAVLGLLDRMAVTRPVVHVVEDLHWADHPTLDLLRFLATNLDRERVLLVATYRDDERLEPAVRTWLAELTRLPVTTRVHLDRLGAGETAALLTQLLGRAPDEQVLERTLSRSAGNPLFVEHLVLESAEDGEPGLPGTLRDLLRSRVDRLPGDTHRVLRAAAVLGRPVPVPVLAAVSGLQEVDVEDLLRPALEQHVVAVRPDETVGFGHPAFVEVVYDALLPTERRRLHRSAAAVLEHGGSSSEVARHWDRAGDASRALVASVAAGYDAERVYAFADAHASFERAVRLAEQGHGAGDELDLVRLREHAARAASLIGHPDEAVRLLGRALEDTTDRRRRAELHLLCGHVHFLAGAGSETERELHAALSLLEPGETSVLAAQVNAALAAWASAWSRLEVADRFVDETLRIACEVGARREEGVALNARGVAASGRGDIDAAVRDLRSALAVAVEVANADDIAGAYVNLSHVLGLAGRLDAVVELCREGTAAISRVGLARQEGSLLLANGAEALLDAARLDQAEELIRQALAQGPRGITAAPVLWLAGRLATLRGDLPLAWDRCDQARLVVEANEAPLQWVRLITEASAEVELWAGRSADAFALATEGLRLIQGTDEAAFASTLVLHGLRALADDRDRHRDPASRHRISSRREELLVLAATMSPHALEDTDRAGGGLLVHAASAATSRAELARLDGRNDPDLWAVAHERWSALGRPAHAAYAQWRQAEARLALRRDADALAALRAAHESARRIGLPLIAAELEVLARWYRVDLHEPTAREDSEGREENGTLAEYGLTAREHEVLRGLVAGQSNQEIADALFISVKTASVHVSNILRKLQAGGRQEAARIARRHGVPG
jgi:DNA-binding CsgD family transcriptional regulator